MTAFIYELLGTCILLLVGNGVVANVVLNKTKGQSSGWIVITLAWAMAVYIGVIVASKGSQAHLNPAVTIAFVLLGKMKSVVGLQYIVAQFLGASLGAFLNWIMYKPHYAETKDQDLILATFCTAPAIPDTISNLISEVIATFVLIFVILMLVPADVEMGSLSALPVSLLVLVIGLGLGGTTGYAINPARDFGPRLMHSILPITFKGNSNWSYSWIPVVGPILGSVLAVILFNLLGRV
jgi:glycerol uptake facilitator protein